jgi:biopolymer transport protein TolQ
MAVDTAVTPVQATDVAGTAAQAAHDLSLVGLFSNADPLVMFVMVMLLLMSVVSWGIIIDKMLTFKTLRVKTSRFEQDFWSADALDQFYEKVKKRKSLHPMAALFAAAMEEWARARGGRPGELQENVKDRMAQMMSVTRNRELDQIEKGLPFLATAGSSAPFIGLFGTVVGIMNSFTSIAGANNTSLAVVAPGIAEALFATAIGLFVAIPAVIAYNKFSQDLLRFGGRLDDFSVEFNTLLSRQVG